MVAREGDGDAWRRAEFLRKGWLKFPSDPLVLAWATAAKEAALASALDPAMRERWLRCEGTWFAGVNALGNAPNGSLARVGVPAVAGAALRFAEGYAGPFTLDPAQVSIVYPGYPKQGVEESEAAFRYRLRRHGAHVDGFERIMPERRWRLSELHGFVLGVPLSRTDGKASPLSVWEGSHEVFRSTFREAFDGVDPDCWRELDSTDAYGRARAESFESCTRVSVAAKPGEAYIVHRLALHGIGPWEAASGVPPRIVAYFRPEMEGEGLPERWLFDP